MNPKNLVSKTNLVGVICTILFFSNWAEAQWTQLGPGATLRIINGSTLSSCGDMWDGIINNGTLEIINSSIDDAKLIANCNGGSTVNVTNSTFDRNFRGFFLHDGNFSNSLIAGNTFTCRNGSIQKDPHDNELTDHHIELNNVEDFTLGSLINAPNNFENARVAVDVINNNITIVNNNFLWRLNSTVDGLAIDVQGAYKGTTTLPDLTTIGGNPLVPATRNTFLHWPHNIEVTGPASFNCRNNAINPATENILQQSTSGIYVSGGNMDIQQNEINRCVTGVQVASYATSMRIANNTFNLNLPLRTDMYDNVAIRCEADMIDDGTKCYILNNRIYNTAIGIRAQNIDADIAENKITWEQTAPLIIEYNATHNDLPHAAIWASNTLGSVRENATTWVGNTNQLSIPDMHGLRIDDCILAVNENKFINMGSGVHVFGNCEGTALRCNHWVANINGVHLDANNPNSMLGTQGSLGANQATSATWDNQWINNFGLHKIGGSTQANQIIWIYDPNASQEFDPNFSEQFVFPVKGNQHDNCSQQLAMINEQGRMAMFGSTVGDSTATDGIDSIEFVISDKKSFYENATNDATVLNLGNANDSKYQQEFDSLEQSNIGAIHLFKQLIFSGDYAAASNIASALPSNNTIESNTKSIAEILATGYSTCHDLDGDTVAILYGIAVQHPFYGGEAVYIARAILRKDVLDGQMQLRNSSAPDTTSEMLKGSYMNIYPNPTEANISVVTYDICDRLEIINPLGVVLISNLYAGEESIALIDVSKLPAGTYFVKLLHQNKVVSTAYFTKVR